jgi:DNA/RNA endonuclease YhcR with UshA esterase domain
MRTMIAVFGLFLTAASAQAETIPACDAGKHIGELITVEGVVTDVHHAKSGKTTFIDECGVYPNNGFSGVIFSDDLAKFPNVDSLKGKTIDITGRLQLYKNRGAPEIILNDPEQLKVK